MKWLPLRTSSRESLSVSMAGIKLGDRLLVVGCSDPVLIARLAVKTGLTGRAYAVDERAALVSAAAAVAAREGALIETATAPWSSLGLDADAFDVAVVRDVLPHLPLDQRAVCLAGIRRALRPGGRCLVIDGHPRGGLAALVRSTTAADPSSRDTAVALFAAQGFKAARVLAEREGLLFAEAVRPAAE